MDEERRAVLTRIVDGELSLEGAAVLADDDWRNRPEEAAVLAELAAERALLRAALPLEQEGHDRAIRSIDAAFAARARRQGWAWSGLPIAASVVTALIVGGGAVLLAEHRAEDAAARMVAAFAADRQLSAAAFTQALDRQVSGQSVSWHNPDTGSGGSVTPLRTFRAADGRYCREYEQRMTAAGGSELRTGIACRDGEGWRPTVERPEPA